MTTKNIKIAFILLFIASPLFVTNSFAVGMGTTSTPPCGGPFPPCPVPLDSKVILLLFAGALYGVKKIYDSMKKNPA